MLPLLLLCILSLSDGPPPAMGAEPADSIMPDGIALTEDGRIAVILAPRRQAVLSAEVTGRITALNLELGEKFAAGEPLLQLDESSYRVNHQIAAAIFESATSDRDRVRKLARDETRQRHADAVLAAAQANLAATQRLYDDDHASRIDLENARRDLAVAQTNRELVDSILAEESIRAERECAVAAGRLEIAAEQLRSCTISAPWDGRVKRVLAHAQELVQPGMPVIEVIDDRILLAKFFLPSSVFGSLSIGQELSLLVAETSKTVSMRVSHIAAALDPASVTFEVHAEVDNTNGLLRAGMNGTFFLSQFRGE